MRSRRLCNRERSTVTDDGDTAMADDAVATGAARRKRLAQRRKTLGLTQEALAGRLGVERTTVVRWERGETEPAPVIRPKLARALQVSADRLEQLLDGGTPGGDGRPGRNPAQPATGRAAGEIFVGRAAELASLESAAAAARSHKPAVVLVEGEAGTGKSTLLSRFASGVTGARVLRASGDEAERLLPYGIVGQFTGNAQNGGLPGLLGSELNDTVDPIAVGADLVAWLERLSAGHGLVLGVIDDIHWADGPSARALLFALRRLLAAPALIVVSGRASELARLGPAWQRFLTGDHRVVRVRPGAFTPAEVAELGRALGRGELPRPVVKRLIAETGGHPLYCRAVLEETRTGDPRGESLQIPRSLAAVVLGRARGLSPAAQDLVTAVAVLGGKCRLHGAARLAQLSDPLPALGEAVAAGILTEQPGMGSTDIGFTHLLVQRAVYGDLSPQRRRELHMRAAGVVDEQAALGHRVAVLAGTDDGLAAELEASARQAQRLGRLAQAAEWLAQAAEASSEQEAADRRFLDALYILVNFGELAAADSLAARSATVSPSTRLSYMLGTLDFLSGRHAAAEEHLKDAWHIHEHEGELDIGCLSALWLANVYLLTGRFREAVAWAEQATSVAPVHEGVHRAAMSMLALSLFYVQRAPEALAALAAFTDPPAEVPPEQTDVLVLRGIARRVTEQVPAAIADLSTAVARLQAGVPVLLATTCLVNLAAVEYRTGAWDDATLHADMAVSRASDGGRALDLASAHSLAALIPAQRGDWPTADRHVRMAREAAREVGDAVVIGTASIAQQYLAMARGDVDGVVAAAAATRASGYKEFFCMADTYDWRFLELEALIRLQRRGQAEAALAAITSDLAVFGPPAARLAAARLRAELALATGDAGAAAAAVADAGEHARDLQAPLLVAQLEITDGRRLRVAGEFSAAVARLTSARQRLARLGAAPHADACDRELAAATASAGSFSVPSKGVTDV